MRKRRMKTPDSIPDFCDDPRRHVARSLWGTAESIRRDTMMQEAEEQVIREYNETEEENAEYDGRYTQ